MLDDVILGVLVDCRRQIERAGECVRDGERERARDAMSTCRRN